MKLAARLGAWVVIAAAGGWNLSAQPRDPVREARSKQPAVRRAPKQVPVMAPLEVPRGAMGFRAEHRFPRDEAQRRVDKLLGYWSQHYGLRYAWNGSTAEVWGRPAGFPVTARVQITGEVVEAYATDPGVLLRDRARGYLQWKLARYLDPKRTLAEVR